MDETGLAMSDSKVKGRLLQENNLVCKDNFGEVKIASIKNIISWKNCNSTIIDVAKAQTEGREARETGNQVLQHKDCNATHTTKATIVLDKPWEYNRL